MGPHSISNFSEEEIHQGGGISNGNLRLTVTLQQFRILCTSRKVPISMETLFMLGIKCKGCREKAFKIVLCLVFICVQTYCIRKAVSTSHYVLCFPLQVIVIKYVFANNRFLLWQLYETRKCNKQKKNRGKKNIRNVLQGNAQTVNPLNAELNPIRHLLALVGARHIVHVSRIAG